MGYTTEEALKISSTNNNWYESKYDDNIYLLNFNEDIILAYCNHEEKEDSDEIFQQLKWDRVSLSNIANDKIMEVSIKYPRIKFTNGILTIRNGILMGDDFDDSHFGKIRLATNMSTWEVVTRRKSESIDVYEYFKNGIKEKKTSVICQNNIGIFRALDLDSELTNNPLFDRLISHVSSGIFIYRRNHLINQDKYEYVSFRINGGKYTASEIVSCSIDEMVDKYVDENIYVKSLSLCDIGKLSENNVIVGFYN